VKNLDDIKTIGKIDRFKMRDILAEFSEQCRIGFQLGKAFCFTIDLSSIKNIIFCGMGGSAIGAEILNYYLRKEIKMAIYLNRDYSLPGFVDKHCLVIVISYSGNTEETIYAYSEAKKRQAKIIVLTSGGQLENLSRKDNCPYLLVPKGLPPRAALGFLFFSILAIFFQIHLVANKYEEVKETVSVLERLKRRYLDVDVTERSNLAKRIAQRIFNKFCVIYAANEHLAGVVTRWRSQLAENSKMLSSSHLFPEVSHNEIVGWQHPQKLWKRFIVIILRDKEDRIQVKKRIDISKKILQREGIEIEEIWSCGENLLARIFSLIYIGDFVSFYLAVLNGEDPTPIKRIDYLKKRLQKC
jgi:glucose/mannose-6-phosphate isomerase